VHAAVLFIIIVGGMMSVFLAFALFVTPTMICPETMQNSKTMLGDPIVELCKYVNHT
jgi:hypothetical protein